MLIQLDAVAIWLVPFLKFQIGEFPIRTGVAVIQKNLRVIRIQEIQHFVPHTP